MPNCIIFYKDQGRYFDFFENFNRIKNWNFIPCRISEKLSPDIKKVLSTTEIHFIFFFLNLNAKTYRLIERIHREYALIHFVYFNTSLVYRELINLFEAGIRSCVIGSHQPQEMVSCLEHLWHRHWRRVPPFLFSRDFENLPLRGKKIIFYLEMNTIKKWYTSFIARYLNISDSHFRAEFRKIFGLSFKDFKQKLINHFEDLLMFDKGYRPAKISKLLNYKHVATFSRAFKTRHGNCWRNIVQNKRYLSHKKVRLVLN